MTVGFAPQTSGRMQSCVVAFEEWLLKELQITLQSLVWDVVAAPLAVRAYGMFLFSSGAPRYRYVYTITGLQDLYPHLRVYFAPAWQIDRKWQQFEPGSCRPVLSGPVMQAVCSISLLWQWHRWLGITLIGFLGMLHPSEMISLTRSDLLLPADTLSREQVFYVFIRHPKTVRFARKQHCKVDDPLVLAYVSKVFGHLPPSTPLFPGGTSQRDHGCTPAVLRGSGATHMFMDSEDLARVQWRGRWSQLKTLEYYIQEVGAQTILAKLPSSAHSKAEVCEMLESPADEVKKILSKAIQLSVTVQACPAATARCQRLVFEVHRRLLDKASEADDTPWKPGKNSPDMWHGTKRLRCGVSIVIAILVPLVRFQDVNAAMPWRQTRSLPLVRNARRPAVPVFHSGASSFLAHAGDYLNLMLLAVIVIPLVWLLTLRHFNAFASWTPCTPLRPRSKLSRRISACAAGGTNQPWQPGPAKVESIPGQKARQLLVENPLLFEDSLDSELEALSYEPDKEVGKDTQPELGKEDIRLQCGCCKAK
eukprot:symbB.v1.2.036602.t1/scaffold5201.1/size46531/4